jgi:hypothetical protein
LQQERNSACAPFDIVGVGSEKEDVYGHNLRLASNRFRSWLRLECEARETASWEISQTGGTIHEDSHAERRQQLPEIRDYCK